MTATSVGNVIDNLAKGWKADDKDSAEAFLHLWREALDAPTEVEAVGDNSLQFKTELSNIYLRGMDEVSCLVLGGEEGKFKATADRFLRDSCALGKLPIVAALSPAACRAATEALPRSRYLLLDLDKVAGLLQNEQPRDTLVGNIREQIPLLQLVPYTIQLPVEGYMFFGREKELAVLRNEVDVSFGIAGPGRIGKTSLTKEYRRRLRQDGDPRFGRALYINCYDCPSTDQETVARFVAMKIHPCSQADRMTPYGLVEFLKFVKKHVFDSPLELILDEVDQFLHTEAFKFLGSAAKQKLCRLILCGRGVLLESLLSEDSSLEVRVELVRLRPLKPGEVQNLLLLPLRELGNTIDEPEELTREVSRLTGCMPHLVQYYAKKLAEEAIETGKGIVSADQLERIKWDYQTVMYFMNPLRQLPDNETLVLALALLKEERNEFHVGRIWALAKRYGLGLSYEQTLRLCNRLVIFNVLAWNNGYFRVCNESLPLYARRMGFLEGALSEAAQSVKALQEQKS